MPDVDSQRSAEFWGSSLSPRIFRQSPPQPGISELHRVFPHYPQKQPALDLLPQCSTHRLPDRSRRLLPAPLPPRQFRSAASSSHLFYTFVAGKKSCCSDVEVPLMHSRTKNI